MGWPLLDQTDSEIASAIYAERARQRTELSLVASENFVSQAVLSAASAPVTDRNLFCDLADQRGQGLFKAKYADASPASGAEANFLALSALAQDNDVVLGWALNAGGHTTHGDARNFSGRFYRAICYGLTERDEIDYEQAARLTLSYRPRVIIAGSDYPRTIDYARFRTIADTVGAYLLVDIAHVAGLIAAQLLPSPLPYAHVVTTTTHKTLRGARGGLILSSDGQAIMALKRVQRRGNTSAPLLAAKAVGLREALSTEFRNYITHVLANGQALADGGYSTITGGTDNHLVFIDLRGRSLTGRVFEGILSLAGIIANRNSLAGDARNLSETSGLRVGSAASTTVGLNVQDFHTIAVWINDLLERALSDPENARNLARALRPAVLELVARRLASP